MLPLLATLVGATAPLIGSFLGSDKKPIVEAGVRLVATALGCPPDAMSIQNALSADPQAMVKLAEFESRERIAIGQQRVTLEQIAADDRHSARDMSNNERAFRLQMLVAISTIVLLFLCIGAVISLVFFAYPSTENTATIALLSAIVGGILGRHEQLMTFCFGSTAGSRAKDDLIYNSTPYSAGDR